MSRNITNADSIASVNSYSNYESRTIWGSNIELESKETALSVSILTKLGIRGALKRDSLDNKILCYRIRVLVKEVNFSL